MQFKLTINCDNAAFAEPDDHALFYEVARILQDAAETIEGGLVSKGHLFDSNGNMVGTYKLTDEESD